jgi:hypothetical protein
MVRGSSRPIEPIIQPESRADLFYIEVPQGAIEDDRRSGYRDRERKIGVTADSNVHSTIVTCSSHCHLEQSEHFRISGPAGA